MPETQSYPYATHLNVLHGPLEVVDVAALATACADRWYNQTLCRVNDSVVRLGVVQGGVPLAQARRRGRVLLHRRGALPH